MDIKQPTQNATDSLAEILRERSGFELSEIDRKATFLELGFDSLFLIQLSQTLRQQLGVKVTFRQLMEELVNVDSLLGFLEQNLPSTASPSTAAPPVAPAPAAVSPASANPEPASQTEQAALPTAPTPDTATEPQEQGPAPPIPAAMPSAQPSSSPSIVNLPVQHVPPLNVPTPPGAVTMPAPTQANHAGTALQQIVLQQTQLMSQHLALLSGAHASSSTAGTATPAPSPPAPAPKPQQTAPQPAPTIESSAQVVAECCDSSVCTSDTSAAKAEPVKPKSQRFGPYKPLRAEPGQGLTPQQQSHLDRFIARFTAKTAGSRRHAEEHRDYFADPRGVAGYRRIWKTMVYQIAVQQSKGSKLWDIDNNEYIDIAMGFGLNLFGQSPEFVTQAVHEQLDRGVEVGPQSPLAGEVAQLLADLSRKDRVTFCNTGSEAVMAALRLARTVTGKSKCVFFNKDYHGNFDEVLLRSNRIAGKRRTSPAAPGVPQQFAENAIVLDYGTEEALQVLRERADEIASVLIEPVQSADPFLQPVDFLREVREITRENDIAMIMDEVISGFRAAPGGAQEWFDVWGDMATYGKVLGGGLPIGALAGSNRFMDALDGGTWRYADASEPEADMTFFAGTFVRHPLAIAAAHQILMKVKEEGPQLQTNLTARTTRMVNRLNSFFEQEQFPIRVAQFTSLFRFMFPSDLEYADMLYFHLLDRGIFTRGWGDNCFLSTAHTDEDIEQVILAVQDSCLEIREGGFFPPRADGKASPPSNPVAISAARSASHRPESSAALQPVASAQTSRTLSVQNAAEPTDQPIASDQLPAGCLISEIQPLGTRKPLFCTPAADGLTLVYHDLADALGDNQPLYGLTSPGVFGETLPTTLEAFCARFIDEIKSIQPEGPYHLLGYCSGGTVAFEIAQQLRDRGEEVAMLACVETYHWQHAASTNPTLAVQTRYQLERAMFVIRNYLLLPPKEKLNFFRSKWDRMWSQLQGIKSHFKAKLRRGAGSNQNRTRAKSVDMHELWKLHDILCEEYRPREYQGKLLHLRPAKDYTAHITDTELPAQEVEYRRLRAFPAGTMTAPYVQELAAHLESEMKYGTKPRLHTANNRDSEQVRLSHAANAPLVSQRG